MPDTEASIVAEYNASPVEHRGRYLNDDLYVTDVNGNFAGYHWVYEEKVAIDFDFKQSILPSTISDIEAYIKDKDVVMTFLSMRGDIKYQFLEKASLVTTFTFNTTEENTIERNSYYISFMLKNGELLENLIVNNYVAYIS